MSEATPAGSDAVLMQLAPDDLHDSPFQPRTVYDGIEELAANLRAERRVHQPLLVRPRTGGGFELVFGHRRKRAAVLAELPTVPCLVRAMSDAEVRSAQLAENVQREAMRALEEAQGYQRMMEEDGLTANEVATVMGKSRSHVYGRLRLLDLCPEVRMALVAGEVQAEVALLIARVGNDRMQQHALKAIRNISENLGDGGARSFRRIRELLNEKFTLDLDKAIFDLEDEMLVPAAGNCIRCHKRTENAPEYADVAGAKRSAEVQAEVDKLYEAMEECEDEAEHERLRQRALELRRDELHLRHQGTMVCTDPDCFEAKKKAHLANEAKALQAEGRTVIAGNKARQLVGAHGEVKGGLIPVDQVKAELAKAATAAKGKPAPQPVLIQDPRDGKVVEAYRPEDLQAAGVKVKTPKAAAKRPWFEESNRRWEEQRRREAEQAAAEAAARQRLLGAVRAAARTRPRDGFELQAVAAAMVQGLDHHALKLVTEVHEAKSVAMLLERIETLSADECGLLLLDCAMAHRVSGDHYALREPPTVLLALAEHYGIDVEAARAVPQTSAPAEPAAAKKAAKKAKAAAEPGRKGKGKAVQGDLLEAAA